MIKKEGKFPMYFSTDFFIPLLAHHSAVHNWKVGIRLQRWLWMQIKEWPLHQMDIFRSPLNHRERRTAIKREKKTLCVYVKEREKDHHHYVLEGRIHPPFRHYCITEKQREQKNHPNSTTVPTHKKVETWKKKKNSGGGQLSITRGQF